MTTDARDTAAASSPRYAVFGPREIRPGNERLTGMSGHDDDYCISIATMPPTVVVPHHSHADRETFYIRQSCDGYAGAWRMLRAGEVFDATDGLCHAWRNASNAEASRLFVTTNRMARLLHKASDRRVGGTPNDEARTLSELVARYGYWCAGRQENAEIGLTIDWGTAAER